MDKIVDKSAFNPFIFCNLAAVCILNMKNMKKKVPKMRQNGGR